MPSWLHPQRHIFWLIRNLGVWYVKHINLELPIISQAVGNCHCLNGDFQFRAPTRNPENIQGNKRCRLPKLYSNGGRHVNRVGARN